MDVNKIFFLPLSIRKSWREVSVGWNGKPGRQSYWGVYDRFGMLVWVGKNAGKKEHKKAALIAKAPELIEVVESLLTVAKQTLKDIGGCDHSVGICCCDLIRKIEVAEEVLNAANGEGD